jgi:hypothetical protein
MGIKIFIDEEYVISEYLKGLSAKKIGEQLGVSNPTILNILHKHNLVRKKDRCGKLNILEEEGKYHVIRNCPKCNCEVKTTSTHKTIACRNHFNALNRRSSGVCKKCSIESQLGEGNPFYGKKHAKESKEKISKSRKGKAMGSDNAMLNPIHREKLTQIMKKKWENGEMEHFRKISSETLKKTRREGKIKSIIRSKKEKEIIEDIKNMGYDVIDSFRVDTKICDMYLPTLNLIIEYNGDYWHCNPIKYTEDYFHQVKGMTARELWDYDNKKIDLIKSEGYNLEVVWENDLKQNPTLINEIIKKYDK